MLRHFEAEGFEDVMPMGRTRPLVLACRAIGVGHPAESMVVKGLGLPEVFAPRQLAAEVLGNAIAHQMGVLTPEPGVVWIGEGVARAINLNLRAMGYRHEIRPGPAAGCELIRPAPAPFTLGQRLTPEMRLQAVRMYLFDLLSQNADRRKSPVNCAVIREGLLAFDFEMAFAHLFLPIIGGGMSPDWEPWPGYPSRDHLLFEVVRENPPSLAFTVELLRRQTVEWWDVLVQGMPQEWRQDADRIGTALRGIVDHAEEFAKNVQRSLI